MKINNTGHVVNKDGITTTPHSSPYWLGADAHRIAFDYLMLDNDRVALHAIYGNALRQSHTEFFYDVIDGDNAHASARNLVCSAFSLMQAHNPNIEIDTYRADDFLSAMASDIAKHKRPFLSVVASN